MTLRAGIRPGDLTGLQSVAVLHSILVDAAASGAVDALRTFRGESDR